MILSSLLSTLKTFIFILNYIGLVLNIWELESKIQKKNYVGGDKNSKNAKKKNNFSQFKNTVYKTVDHLKWKD